MADVSALPASLLHLAPTTATRDGSSARPGPPVCPPAGRPLYAPDFDRPAMAVSGTTSVRDLLLLMNQSLGRPTAGVDRVLAVLTAEGYHTVLDLRRNQEWATASIPRFWIGELKWTLFQS